jgi:ssDNA-binding Zn-finger/Zn-ribbon topoisomerase 1
MPTAERIIGCECGANVRLPRDTANRSFRCPACKTALALTVNAKVLTARQLRPGEDAATCPICQTAIAAEEFFVTCPKCDQVHHRECWSEIGGCGTYGCEQAPAIDKSTATAAAPLSAWGDTKKCPMCGEQIKSIALRCRYCGTDFDTADPLSIKDLHLQSKREESLKALRQSTLTIFVVSIIGCVAPIIGLIGLAYFLPKRKELARCGPLYQVMAVASLILSAIYTVLLVVVALFGSS